MSKRFVDTGIFDDDWFMDLSKDAKLLWLYFITKCDHAGILKLNEKLCKVQTDIKDLTGTIKQLGNRLVTVSEHLYFIPKFIEFQYPGFPKSNVKQQDSVIKILTKYNLIQEGKIRVSEELPNTYVYVNGNDNGNEEGKIEKLNIPEFEEFKEYALRSNPSIDILGLELKYKAWIENNWRDGNGKKIINWKSKLLNTMPFIKVKQMNNDPFLKYGVK
jgi:hypothetical protein